MVLVDSDVWSEAFRRGGRKSRAVSLLQEFIENDEVVMIGPVRQETLSGIREKRQFEEIQNILRAFPSACAAGSALRAPFSPGPLWLILLYRFRAR